MAMFPHERSLVEKYKNRPFTILGVNSDGDKKSLLEKNAKEKITWPSFWDKSTGGEIATAWNISGWPTIYVIDHEGIIRYKNVRGESLDTAIAELVAQELYQETIQLTPADSRLRALLFEQAAVAEETYAENGDNLLRLRLQLDDFKKILAKSGTRADRFIPVELEEWEK